MDGKRLALVLVHPALAPSGYWVVVAVEEEGQKPNPGAYTPLPYHPLPRGGDGEVDMATP